MISLFFNAIASSIVNELAPLFHGIIGLFGLFLHQSDEVS